MKKFNKNWKTDKMVIILKTDHQDSDCRNPSEQSTSHTCCSPHSMLSALNSNLDNNNIDNYLLT